MQHPHALVSGVVVSLLLFLAPGRDVEAQPLGTFSWQLQPFCNVVTLRVTQNGPIFTLDGFDHQCGAATRAAVTGLAFFNPNGTVGLGLTIVLTPGGAPVHVDATITPATLSGTWRDSEGNTGTFAFNQNTGGQPRDFFPGALIARAVSSATAYYIGGQTVLSSSGVGNLTVGVGGGPSNPAATGNTTVGALAGQTFTGSNNTFLGARASAAPGLDNATAIGANAYVEQDNALVLGSISGVNLASADTRVGIGTSAPAATLDIESVGDASAIMTRFGGQPPTLQLRRAKGSRAAPTPVLLFDHLGTVNAGGYTGAGFSPGKVAIFFEATENWSASATGARMRFLTTPNGSGVLSSRMVIDHDGQVGIGTTLPLNMLHVAGDIRVGTGTAGCVVDADGTFLAGSACSSDLRFKRDVAPFAPALEAVTGLQPVHFYWRSREFPEKAFGERLSYGLVAQEVERILPELVTTDEDGYKAVNYSKLPLLAIQAIKELKERNDALEQRLRSLEALVERVSTEKR